MKRKTFGGAPSSAPSMRRRVGSVPGRPGSAPGRAAPLPPPLPFHPAYLPPGPPGAYGRAGGGVGAFGAACGSPYGPAYGPPYGAGAFGLAPMRARPTMAGPGGLAARSAVGRLGRNQRRLVQKKIGKPASGSDRLGEKRIEQMRNYLEDRGGALDLGSFCREFPRVRKTQLEELSDTFTLIQDSEEEGGRWQITLIGAVPLEPGDRPVVSAEEAKNSGKDADLEKLFPGYGDHFSGHILSYNATKSWGFIKCEEITQGDIYFKRSNLPLEAQMLDSHRLAGRAVELEVGLTPDGKPRVINTIRLSDPSSGDIGEKKAMPKELNDKVVEEMEQFLHENQGSMDFGKFAKTFRGFKKAQLEQHFTIVAENGDKGGKCLITLNGVDPIADDPPTRVVLEPSSSLLVLGTMKKWNQGKGYGFLAVPGMQKDVMVHRENLPDDIQEMKIMNGVKFAFRPEDNDGKLRATDVIPLLAADARSGWQLAT